MKSLLVTATVLFSHVIFAASASVECMEYVYSDAGYNKVKAAQACSNGATVACIKHVYSDVGYDKVKAALVCGEATVECIDYVYSDAGYSKANAAMACNGKN